MQEREAFLIQPCLLLSQAGKPPVGVTKKRNWKSWIWDGYGGRAGHGATGRAVCQKQALGGDQVVSGVWGESAGEGLGESLRALSYSTCEP